MCNPYRPNVFCSKLSDFDDLCARISHRHRLSGFYRAFMSTSTQWLTKLFDGICMNARIVNMQVNKSVLWFYSFVCVWYFQGTSSVRIIWRDFRTKSTSKWNSRYTRFKTSVNNDSINCMNRNWSCFFLSFKDFSIGGTEVFRMGLHQVTHVNQIFFEDKFIRPFFLSFCQGLDWSRQDDNYSGVASSLSNSMNGLFGNRYKWPCSTMDFNIGILCIETNCEKRNAYKH